MEDVRIFTLPPRTTAKHQPLDLGQVGHCKTRYRDLLSRATIETIEARKETQRNIPRIRRMYGILDGQLPHVEAQQCEAILNELQDSEEHFIDLTNLSEDASHEKEAVVDDVTCKSVISELQTIATNKNLVENNPLHDVLKEIDVIQQVSELMAVLNSPAPFGDDSSRNQLADSFMESIIDESRGDEIDSDEVIGSL